MEPHFFSILKFHHSALMNLQLTFSCDLDTFPLFSTSRAVKAYQMDLSSSERKSMTAPILLSVFPFFTAFSFSRSVVQGHPHPPHKCASSNWQITPPAGPKLNQKGIKFSKCFDLNRIEVITTKKLVYKSTFSYINDTCFGPSQVKLTLDLVTNKEPNPLSK